MSAQSRKRHINMDVGGPGSFVSAVFVPSTVHPAKLESSFPASTREGSPDTGKPMTLSENMLSKKIDEMEPVKVDPVFSRVSILDDHDEKAVSVRQLSRENYRIVNIVANLNQIRKVQHPL